MAKKTQKTTVTTPIGTLVWPYLLVPDTYQNKEEYKADIKLSKKDAEPIIKEIKNKLEAYKKKQRVLQENEDLSWDAEHLPYKEDGEDILFRAKTKRYGKSGGEQFENRVSVFDGQGGMITDKTLDIYTGSTARLKLELYAWNMNQDGKDTVGVSLRLLAAQVISLADRPERDAESYGFDAVEGGFDSSAPADFDEGTPTGSSTCSCRERPTSSL